MKDYIVDRVVSSSGRAVSMPAQDKLSKYLKLLASTGTSEEQLFRLESTFYFLARIVRQTSGHVELAAGNFNLSMRLYGPQKLVAPHGGIRPAERRRSRL